MSVAFQLRWIGFEKSPAHDGKGSWLSRSGRNVVVEMMVSNCSRASRFIQQAMTRRGLGRQCRVSGRLRATQVSLAMSPSFVCVGKKGPVRRGRRGTSRVAHWPRVWLNANVSNSLAPPFFVPRLSDHVLIVACVTLPLTPDFFKKLCGCYLAASSCWK